MVTTNLKFLMLANALSIGFKDSPPLYIATNSMCATGWERNHKHIKLKDIQPGRNLLNVQEFTQRYSENTLFPSAIQWYKDNINNI